MQIFCTKNTHSLLRKAFALLHKSKANVPVYADAFDLLVFEAFATSACLSKNVFFDKQRLPALAGSLLLLIMVINKTTPTGKMVGVAID